jgi:hypothetical protein
VRKEIHIKTKPTKRIERTHSLQEHITELEFELQETKRLLSIYKNACELYKVLLKSRKENKFKQRPAGQSRVV